MSIKVNTGLVADWYTPESEKDSDNPARFKLKPLDGLTQVDVYSKAKITEQGGFVPTRQAAEVALRASLIEWENIDDANGRPLKCSPHNFRHLPGEIVQELTQEILIRSDLDEDDEKN